jgi:hypothetical protein
MTDIPFGGATMRTTLAILVSSTLVSSLAAQPPQVKTLMTEPVKLLHREELNQPLGKDWIGKPGDWTIVDGALRGAERKADMHGAVRRLPLNFTSAIIQYEFKLDGAGQSSLSINGVKGHVCRVILRPDSLAVQKDKDKKTGAPGVVLERREVKIAPGQWHTLTVELHGKEMLASLDSKHVAFGAHDGIDVPKANLGFTVAGQSASFRNLHVWEARSNPRWEATRQGLLQARKAQ